MTKFQDSLWEISLISQFLCEAHRSKEKNYKLLNDGAVKRFQIEIIPMLAAIVIQTNKCCEDT